MSQRHYKLGSAYAFLVWIIAVVFVVYLFSIQTGYAIVSPYIQKSLGLSISAVGIIAAIYTWFFAVAQFFGGAFLDRLGARRVLSVSIALVTAGVFVFANASSFSMLIISQIILALGACTGFVGAGYVGGQWFGMAKFSLMFGLVQFVAAITSSFSQNAFNLALKHFSWSEVMNWVGVFGVALFIVGVVFIKNPIPLEKSSQTFGQFFASILKKMGTVLKIPHVWLASLIGGITFGAVLAVGVVWSPRILEAHGISTSTANFATSLVWLGLALGSPLVTSLSDHFKNRKRIILITAAIQMLCLVPLLFIDTPNIYLLMIALFIFGASNAGHMLTFSTAGDVVTLDHIGTSASIVNGFMFIFGGLMISIPGKLVVSGAPWNVSEASRVYLPIFGLMLFSFILSLFLKETYPRS